MTTTLPPGRILFVDDEPALLAGLERSLRPTRHFWQCEYLSDPIAALDRLETTAFDVIVSDMRMPGMNGAEFLAHACQTAPDSVRLMLTGNADLQTAIAAVNCGHIFQFLQKPCEGERLIERLSAAIFQHRLQLSEREVLRLKLEQAEKMTVVGRLAAGITHDLNNILGAILIQAELELMEQAGATDENSGLRVIHESAKRAAELTREINSLSRCDQKSFFQRLAVPEIINAAVRMSRPLLGRKIMVNFESPADLPDILADAGKVKQALLNLLLNARDAMPEGGTVNITATTVEFPERDVADPTRAAFGPFVCISVTDTGTGIETSVLRRLEEPFFTTKPDGKGTGLGLFMVKRALEEHDGWLEIASAPGAGSTFRMFLPVKLVRAT